MGKRIRKLKKQRLHSEGNDTLFYGLLVIIAVAVILWRSLDTKIPFWCFVSVAAVVYGIVLNFFRCPIRYFPGDDTERVVVAPADGKVVVIEEVEDTEYFHDKRLMISIFMSLFNVHANWFPVDGKVKTVYHQNGNFHKAWLPKASEENEHADVMIETPEGVDVLCRQIAGAVARRIVEKTVTLPVNKKDVHELTIVPRHPGIVFEKIVVDCGGYQPQYLFGNESPATRK